MKYTLINEPNLSLSAMEQILMNRGVKDIRHYLNASDKDINSPLSFGKEIMDRGVQMLMNTIKEEQGNILIIEDSDCDGCTSCALLLNYLHDAFPSYTDNHVSYYIHSGKQHGLSDCYNLALKYKLVICPDSSSNDFEYHKILFDNGVNVLVLDHHEADVNPLEYKYACIINNQLSPYPNKELSGVGVTWQFCRYLDMLAETNFAEHYLDLVALGNMADMMSLKSIETMYLITKGFDDNNIRNPFIFYMAQKNRYSLGDKITPMGAAFYIAPFVNSMVRSGTLEEKELLFKSMLKYEALKEIDSTKRGHKGEKEKLVEQAVRTAINVKNRQTRAQDAGLEFLEKMIVENNLLENKVLLFLLQPGQVDRNIAGLIANKFMAKYQRPCCILTRVEDENGISYQGSARGYDKGGVTNFKDICAEVGSVMYAEGHQGAFGLGINEEGVTCFINKTNESLKSMSSEPTYLVDYIYNNYDVNGEHIIEIADMENYWGKDIDEPFIAIHNLQVTKDMVVLMSPDKKPTLKINLPNGVSLIKFNSSQEEYESFLSKGYKKFDIIGRCNKNEWCGNISAQVIIEDYEEIGSCKYIF